MSEPIIQHSAFGCLLRKLLHVADLSARIEDAASLGSPGLLPRREWRASSQLTNRRICAPKQRRCRLTAARDPRESSLVRADASSTLPDRYHHAVCATTRQKIPARKQRNRMTVGLEKGDARR